MSAAAMIRKQGSRVTVYRGTAIANADGNRAVGSPWTEAATGIPITIQNPTAEKVTQVFGAEFLIDAEGYADPDAIAEDDRLTVTAGPYAGQRYAVLTRIPHRMTARVSHDQLGLQVTTEVFP